MVTDFHVKIFRKYLFNCIILHIASSNKCTTEKLSSLLTPCCKTILIHYKEYCEGIYRHTGVKCYWIVDNSNKVLKRLHNINNNVSQAKCFDSYDFATLYTNIPHEGLKMNIYKESGEGGI